MIAFYFYTRGGVLQTHFDKLQKFGRNYYTTIPQESIHSQIN